MDRMTLMVLVVLVAASPHSAAADSVKTWQPYIAEAALRFGLPESWIRAVMQAESGGRTTLDGRPMTSRAGAMGLMQMMPETYEVMRNAYRLGPDAYAPHDNILAGAVYLRVLYDRYGYPGFFAAYNAGPARYDAYLHDGRPLPDETKTYLATLAQMPLDLARAVPNPAGGSLFFTLRTTENASQDAQTASPGSGIFVPLSPIPDPK